MFLWDDLHLTEWKTTLTHYQNCAILQELIPSACILVLMTNEAAPRGRGAVGAVEHAQAGSIRNKWGGGGGSPRPDAQRGVDDVETA